MSNISDKDKAKIGGMFIDNEDNDNNNLDHRLSSGKVLHLNQGDKVVLQNEDNSVIDKISLGVGWSPSGSFQNMDLDASVLVYSNKQYSDLIYFGKLKNSNNSIFHHGDNLYGSKGKSEDQNDEDIDIELNRLNNSVDELYLVVNIYNAFSRGQSFGTVKDLYIRVYSFSNNKKNLRLDFIIDQGKQNYSGVVIAKMRKSPSGVWDFKAVGEYGNADDPDQMKQYCR